MDLENDNGSLAENVDNIDIAENENICQADKIIVPLGRLSGEREAVRKRVCGIMGIV